MGDKIKIYRTTPSTKDNLWGGNKLRKYGKTSEADRIAESWELSFVPGSEARLEDGRTLSEAFGRDAWGDNSRDFESFPCLTKLIDAREKLSVQVHPADDYALKNEGQYGKTEMWYVVEAEEGAGIYMGLKREATPEEFAERVADGSVEELLSFREVKAGEVYFIPAGTVHAIGAGVLIFEVQQNSTLTYRLYDYMRRGSDGKLRELHVDKAMAVASLKPYEAPPRDEKKPNIIGSCKYFEVEEYKLNFTKTTIISDPDTYVSITCVRGSGKIDGLSCSAGDSFFAPCGGGEIEMEGDMTIIVTRTPKMP